MSRIEDLAALYGRHIGVPWARTVAGDQRVILVVYDKDLERPFRARKGEFEQCTRAAHHGWVECDCTRLFAEWMAQDEYREAYFETPEDLNLKLSAEFTQYVAAALQTHLEAADADTVVAVVGVSCLYGFARVSDVVPAVASSIKGRLVIFFPGTKDGDNYRLLDARDGWNYLAQAITLHSGGGIT